MYIVGLVLSGSEEKEQWLRKFGNDRPLFSSGGSRSCCVVDVERPRSGKVRERRPPWRNSTRSSKIRRKGSLSFSHNAYLAPSRVPIRTNRTSHNQALSLSFFNRKPRPTTVDRRKLRNMNGVPCRCKVSPSMCMIRTLLNVLEI